MEHSSSQNSKAQPKFISFSKIKRQSTYNSKQIYAAAAIRYSRIVPDRWLDLLLKLGCAIGCWKSILIRRRTWFLICSRELLLIWRSIEMSILISLWLKLCLIRRLRINKLLRHITSHRKSSMANRFWISWVLHLIYIPRCIRLTTQTALSSPFWECSMILSTLPKRNNTSSPSNKLFQPILSRMIIK